MKFQPGGVEIAHEDYLKNHGDILGHDEWILDGFGCVASTWQRMEAADTLIYVDLALWRHVWWVTKRLMRGAFTLPEGWPEKSPILKSSWNSFRVFGLCHKKLTPQYRQYVAEAQNQKQVFHLRTPQDIRRFLEGEAIKNS